MTLMNNLKTQQGWVEIKEKLERIEKVEKVENLERIEKVENTKIKY